MEDNRTKASKQERGLAEPVEAVPALQKEVQEIKQAVDEAVTETNLTEKVDELRTNIEGISEEVQSSQAWSKDTYVEILEALKSQVNEIQSEWANVSATMKAQRERLESMLESFPGVIETASLRALSLRVTHIEKLVSKLIEESNAKSATARARKQLIVSLVALGITVILWGLWIGLTVTK